jgi:hypothetical protein
MSLRSQIRDAVDDVAPAPLDIERKVSSYVRANNAERKALRARRQRSPWAYRFQGAATLLAAALVVAVIAGLVFGGRFWRDLNSTPSTINQTELKSLESRPLSFPTVAPDAACPVTPVTLNPNIGMVLGAGPVYLGNRDIYETSDWGFWVAAGFWSEGKTPGLVLIRAKDLKSGAQVAFAQYPLAPTRVTAVGRVLGSTQVADHQVQLRSEAVFTDPWPQARPAELVVLFGMETGTSGCIGFQVNGPDFDENFVLKPAQPSF